MGESETSSRPEISSSTASSKASESLDSDVSKGANKSSDTENELPDLDDSDVEQAVVKIQAAFKGSLARKKVKGMKGGAKKKSIDSLPDLEDKDVQVAASKIQAAFRGHQVRSNV